jgi:heme-degrading monooxygenase HmoA
MFVRLTRVQIRVERIEQALKIYKESIVPTTRDQVGFLGICLFMNSKTGEAISQSYWRSEEDVLASEENHHYQEQLVKVMNTFTAPPVREGYEVEVCELKDLATFAENI